MHPQSKLLPGILLLLIFLTLFPDILQGEPLTNIYVKASGNPNAYSGEAYFVDVEIYNLTGESKDSLLLVMYAPNELKAQAGKDSLFATFEPPLIGSDTCYSDVEEDTTNLDGLNPLQKLRKLSIRLTDLAPTSGINPLENPHFFIRIKLHLAEIPSTWKLVFNFEVYDKTDTYIRGADAVWEVPFVQYPAFTLFKDTDRYNDTYAPGDTGNFIIRYGSTNIDVTNLWIYDKFPDRLLFLGSNPDTLLNPGPEDGRLAWFDSLLKTGVDEFIRFRFSNNILRRECLGFDGTTYADPEIVTNLCELNWRAVVSDTSVQRACHITIKAEPDLYPEISQTDTTTTVSPGSQVALEAVGRNRGGSGVDTTVGFKVAWASLIDGIPQSRTVFETFQFEFDRLNPLHPTVTDSIDTLFLWNAPARSGWYRIYIEIDPDSLVDELDDLYLAGRMDPLDGPFPANNLDSLDIFVGIDALNVDVTHVTFQDTSLTRAARTISGGFPNYIFSYVHVTDQNNRFIQGLADTLRWLGANDTIPVLLRPVAEIWKPLLENHRDEPGLPANPDVYQTRPEFLITEVHDSSAISLAGAGVAAALVLDYSGSMHGQTENLEKSARIYLGKMLPQDRASILKFGNSVSVLQKLTSDPGLLQAALQTRPSVGNGTALYDAVYQGIAEVANAPGSKIVIAFTDGRDGVSSRLRAEITQYALQLGVAVFTIGYGSNVAVSELTQIASTTGGKFFFSEDWQEINQFYHEISGAVRNYYILAHTTPDPAPNGTWRALSVGVDYLGQAADSDTGQYLAPVEGVNLWANVTSFPDSTVIDPLTGEIIAKYALPGDTVSYVITFGNRGIQVATDVSLENFLPEYIRQLLRLSLPAQTSTTDGTLVWNLSSLAAGEVRTITFDLVLSSTTPDYVVPLIDSVRIFCTAEKTEDHTDNLARDQVMLLPLSMALGEIFPPAIRVTPPELFALEPDTFRVFTKSPLKWWDIWIFRPDGTVDRTNYSGAIADFRQNRMPLMGNTPPLPDSSLTILPPFFDTLVPDNQDTAIYRICLAYVDWFRNDTAFVYDTLTVKSNRLRPDLVPRLDRLELSKPRTPGQPILITGTIKNIGGRALTAQDAFAASIFYCNLSLAPNYSNYLETQILAGPLQSFEKDSLAIGSITWTPPDTGLYEIVLVADAESQILESHDADPGFPENNVCTQTVTVRYEPPEVQITHIFTSGQLDHPDLIPLHFPENIATILNVTDQNNLPISGLADTLSWRRTGEMTNVNLPFEAIWTPSREYRRGQPGHPANPDLTSSLRVIEIARPGGQLMAEPPNPLDSFRAQIALLTDYSANMTPHLAGLATAVPEFFRQLMPEDSVLALPFADEITIRANFTGAPAEFNLPAATASPNYRLLDAVHHATTLMLPKAGRKFILVLTAGGNETSLHDPAATIEWALRSQTPVFIFNCGPDTSLADISRNTGGKFYHLPEWGSLNAMFTDFATRLNHFYLALHTSPDRMLDGTWRTVDLSVRFAGKSGADQNHYPAPLDGFDGWVRLESRPDSVNAGMKFTKANAFIGYSLTYGNNGYQTGTGIRLRNILPDSVSELINPGSLPNQANGRERIWELGDLAFGESGSIQFEVRVNPEMPPYWFWLVDSLQLLSPVVGDRDLQNNLAIDTVLVQPDEWSEPQIVAFPAEVAVNDPVTLSITTRTPLKSWNIFIEYPVSSAQGIDRTGFNNQIQNRTEPLMPLAPDAFLQIEPDFTNTKIWNTGGTSEQRENYQAILEYIDWFDRPGTTTTTFTVFAKYELWLGQNKFNPDADADLEVHFLSILDQPVRIKIYNVAGELVRTLHDQFIRAGQHSVMWDGRDQNDRVVGSDVYVIILEAGAYKEWRKVVVVR